MKRYFIIIVLVLLLAWLIVQLSAAGAQTFALVNLTRTIL